jgi:RNA polymerase sigma factor (sigma-70 family)
MRDQPDSYIYPPRILPVIEKPGREWSHEEYSSVVAWLFEEPQLRKLLTLCLFGLGSMATPQDAEDALMEFCEKRLEKVSRLFDPERGGGFWGYLRFCLKREAGHLRKLIEKTSDQELGLEETYQATDGEVEFERASTADQTSSDQWEFNLLMKELLIKLSPPYRDAFILVKLEDRDYEKAAAILSISPGLARIRVHRAIEKLRHNEKLKLYLGMTRETEEEE